VTAGSAAAEGEAASLFLEVCGLPSTSEKADSRGFCLTAETLWTGESAGVLAELMSLAMSRYKCSDSPLDDSELSDASLRDDDEDERLLELDNGRLLKTSHKQRQPSPASAP